MKVRLTITDEATGREQAWSALTGGGSNPERGSVRTAIDRVANYAKHSWTEPEDEPEGDWPGWEDVAHAGLQAGMGPGPNGYWSWRDVALALQVKGASK